VNLASLRKRIEALTGRRAPAQLPANFVDPIAAMLRAQIAAGATPTPTTPERREAALARLRERLEEAGRIARARTWS
jgi:hypothetical protein